MNAKAQPKSANFNFLARRYPDLERIGALCERYFSDDPIIALITVRQFGELLAQMVAARSGLLADASEPQADLLRRLRVDANYPRNVLDLFHQLRVAGNAAVHRRDGDHATALSCLKMARQLGIWFYRTFDDQNFKSGPFQPPRPPIDATAELTAELARLRAEKEAALTEAQRAKEAVAEAEAAKLVAEQGAKGAAEEKEIWAQLAAESEAAKEQLSLRLAILQGKVATSAIEHLSAPQSNASREAAWIDANQLAEQMVEWQAAAVASPAAEKQKVVQLAEVAAEAINLDEADTRQLVDEQLRERGWDADSVNLRYAKGARPIKGKSMAIAEWPTPNGPADYALFVGMTCIGLVEAKRKRKNIQAAIDQTGRYAQAFVAGDGIELPEGGPWRFSSGETNEQPFRVPFLFATNGRPYLKQVETQSGIWFRDARHSTNLRRALTDWPTPEGLTAELNIDRQAAQERLASSPIEFGFPLRDYQKRAIRTVENALTNDANRTMLLAMATGTGKTKLAIALLYRLLETKRFRRVCFVVDRHALGDQAANEFKTTRIVSTRTFADIFGLKELGDISPETATKVHICTIQGLVKRVLFANENEDVPPVDQYDLIIVDECHRGYLLDREMSDAELSFRSETDYISKYRRVLEHFDAVKIGLTATPALHTVQIFGDPIFTYSYREAVIDGFLIDHDPPIRIETELSRDGIHFARGEQLPLLDATTGQIDLTHAPDDLDFQVSDFNRKVITRSFNRVVCEELAKQIDPSLPGKTLVFAATDGHADIVVDELKKAFERRYGSVDDATVAKITGSVDDPGKLIRSYRNDAAPSVAVTVDLLTTGIDVPKIENLVFIRRVSSRILYEQMLGRATRLCPEIGKETFRIFDAVGIYEALQSLTAMKPVVVNPKLTLTQLLEEFARVTDPGHRGQLRDEILVKLRRAVGKLTPQAQEAYEAAAGEPVRTTLNRLAQEPLEGMATWVKGKPGIGPILDWRPEGGRPIPLPISVHPDKLVGVTSGYGATTKPEDFLISFERFVRENVNKVAALRAVVQRPRELTRDNLKAVRMELDRQGFSEAALRNAWKQAKNEDIAASIVGFIRQAALGDPLLPWADRVKTAMDRIGKRGTWSEPQRKWLERIGKAVAQVGVADRAVLDEGQFREETGGFTRLDRIFDGRLEAILGDINDELWSKSA
ncbi:type I restriction-modification system endonuclease [Bradyrhizobium sp. CSA112]|uniref:type I restriction-modification system endonuclease n=1 Tax=Bradyrhizobium sp. CSA112 TaxID=2699170 RepID=UPI0023B18EEB|nr:type I restriction-modification system endonuclease [Bradyrhizobium sp. CSA112]MDE5452546.1 type I restriction-modification system endonuclease [Bradyrhizobium sp. CSA112]